MTLLRYVVIQILWAYSSQAKVPVCEQPPEVDFGDILSGEKSEYVESDRVQYRCYPGYTLAGSEWITCNGGSWTQMPKCLAPCTITKQQLEEKNLFVRNNRRRTVILLNAQTVEFSCSEGYNLTVPSVRMCADGHIIFPLCIPQTGKKCGCPPTIDNGDITTFSQKEYASGSSVEYKCQQFYTLDGQNTSFCNNGNWTQPPACVGPCVVSVTKMESHDIELSEKSKGKQYIPHGDFVQFKCKRGYAPPALLSTSDFTVRCYSGNISYPQCHKVTSCGHPGDIRFGFFEFTSGTEFVLGARVEYTCDEGYRMLSQSNFRECLADGWSNDVPHCEEKNACGLPRPLENGKLRQEHQTLGTEQSGRVTYPNSTVLEYACHTGFVLKGQSKITCSMGTWTEGPTCDEMPCGKVPSVLHSVPRRAAKSHYVPGETVRYECKRGFSIRGEQNIICKAGNWTKPPTCEDVRCGPPPKVVNADILHTDNEMYLPGTRVQYKCHRGFQIVGSNQVICENREWSQLPTCQEGSGRCGRPPIIENGDITTFPFSHYEPDSTVKYKCKHLYIMKGSEYARCNSGQWTDPPTCIEPCTAFEQDMAENNIRLKWASGEKLYSASGDVVEFDCIRGYVRDPASPPFRVQCQEGKLLYPRCRPRDVTCGPPPEVVNADIIHADNEMHLPGTRVRYKCHRGFQIVGSNQVICENREWSQLPTCQEGSGRCGRPPVIENGDITTFPFSHYEPDSTVKYKCKHLYIMKGSEYALCNSGQWTDPPTCIEPCTAFEQDMAENNIRLKWASGKKLYSSSGDVVEFACIRGYVRDPASPPFRVQCQEGKLLYPRCRPRGTSG